MDTRYDNQIKGWGGVERDCINNVFLVGVILVEFKFRLIFFSHRAFLTLNFNTVWVV